jgi:hypothetical protein
VQIMSFGNIGLGNSANVCRHMVPRSVPVCDFRDCPVGYLPMCPGSLWKLCDLGILHTGLLAPSESQHT